MTAIKTIIIDDEALARKRIIKLLERDNDIDIVAECKNGKEALECINRLKPDLLFLDVQMPELDGFKVLEKFKGDKYPIVIFVTAYDKYALKAFDVHAIDYLLKPFDDDRFYEALKYAKEHHHKKEEKYLQDKMTSLLSDFYKHENYNPHPSEGILERIVVKSAGKINFVKVDEIIRIKAAGKYLEILTPQGEHLLRETMNELECKLPSEKFLRIHRSTIVNLDHIKEMQTYFRGDYIVILTNNEKFTTSQGYKSNLEKLLGSQN